MRINKALIALISASVLALALGAWGFYHHAPSHGWSSALYRAVQLFGLEFEMQSKEPAPISLELARWLALAVVLGGAYVAIAAVMRHFKTMWRVTSMRGHTVVCGAGRRGAEIAKSVRNHDSRDVVVIDTDENNAVASELRNLGAEFLVGNALDLNVLKRAGVGKADALVAVTGDDELNLAICALAEQNVNPRCSLIAGVESWAWRTYFVDRLRPNTRIRLDSFLSRAARALMLEIAKDAATDDAFRRSGIRLLIEADEAFRQELVRAAAVVVQISGDNRPRLDLTGLAREEAEKFAQRFPGASLVVDIAWKDTRATQAFAEGQPKVVDYAVFARANDAETLEAAGRFSVRHDVPASRVFACLSGSAGVADSSCLSSKEDGFVIRSLVGLGLGKADPLESGIEQAAAKCHHAYWDAEKAKDPGFDALPRNWNDLPERYRESNRLAAMHHEVKRRMRTAQSPGDEVTLMDHLSRCEHMRWMAEKVMDGWRWSGSTDPSTRNNAKLKHHLLVPYDELPLAEQEKDTRIVREALAADP